MLILAKPFCVGFDPLIGAAVCPEAPSWFFKSQVLPTLSSSTVAFQTKSSDLTNYSEENPSCLYFSPVATVTFEAQERCRMGRAVSWHGAGTEYLCSEDETRSPWCWQVVGLNWSTSKTKVGHPYLCRLALNKWFYPLTVTVIQF